MSIPIIKQCTKLILAAVVILFLMHHTVYGVYYNERTFYSVNDIHGVSLRTANSVVEDDKGFIWASSKTGVLRLTEDDSRSYLLPYVTPDVITIKLIYGVRGLFAYSNNGQFFRYDDILDQFVLYFDLRPMLGTNRITIFNVLIDRNGFLYIPSNMGLHRYSITHTLDVLMSGEIRYLDWYDNDHLFTSSSDGIKLVNTSGQEKEFYSFESLPGTTQVSTLFYNKNNTRLWIGTQAGNLLYLSIGEKIIKNAHHLLIFHGNPFLPLKRIPTAQLWWDMMGRGFGN
jgi:ligand-binding sensor domain-containing protein